MTTPTLPSLNLSQDEDDLITQMRQDLMAEQYHLDLRNAYYEGEQVVRDLGISIPPQLKGLHTVLGWPRIGVDALEQRLDIDSWRYAGGSDDEAADVEAIWAANQGGLESHLGHLDALVYGRGYVAVGSGDCDTTDCLPLISVESPLHMTSQWDARSRTMLAGLRVWCLDDQDAVTLYQPQQTVQAVRGSSGWQVIDRDVHNLGVTPVVRLGNRQRTAERVGRSEITPEVMSITDAACRTLLGLETAREFFAAPQRYILGASESAFQDADGTPKGAWETYIGRVLALERDEDGNVPQIGQFTAYDPSAFTRVIDLYARIMATQLGLPPHYLGYTTDNPASADAIRSTEAQLIKRAERKQRLFGAAWSQVMQLALLIRGGFDAARARAIEPVWRNAATPTIAASTDAAVKLVKAGILAADSDVTYQMIGLTAGQRAQARSDARRAGGLAAMQAALSNLAKEQTRPGAEADEAA